MSLTPTITYIKNGQEKTITVTKWNKRKIRKEIYKLTYQFDLINYQIYGDMYTIQDDIELIHFKNLSFHKAQKIKSSKNTLCIFENCNFVKRKKYFHDIYFEGGKFELIDPTLINNVIATTTIISDNELNIIYTKNKENPGELTLILTSPYLKSNHYTLKVIDHKNIHNLISSVPNLDLSGELNLVRLRLMGNNITIGNLKEKTSIKTFGPLSSDITSKEKIKLTNCAMESIQAREIIKLDSPQVEVENIILQANNMIKIKDNYHLKKTDEKEVTITDKELSRSNLITVLKGYKTILETQFEHQLNNESVQQNISIKKNISKKHAKTFGQNN